MELGEKVAWIALHALIFLVPLAVSNINILRLPGVMPLTYDQFDIVKLFTMRACTLVALGGWGAHILLRGGKIRLTKIDWLVLVFLVWVGITTVTSIHWPTALFGKYRRFEGLISFVNYAAVFFLTVQLVDRRERMLSLVRTLFFSGSLVMIYGTLQYLGIELIPYGTLPFEARRSFATYGNPDLLGGFLMFMLPISITLALAEKDAGWRILYWIGAVLTAIVTITAFTRSAWVGGAAAIIVLVMMLLRQTTNLSLRREDLVMGGIAIAAAVVVVVRSLSAPSEIMNFFARIRSIFEFSEGSALTRFQIWDAAGQAIRERPVLGFGADTFRLVFPRFKPAAYVAAAGYLSVADNVHNYPLQLASALGIPGVLLLYGLFVWVLVLSFKRAFATAGPESGDLVYSGLWAAVVGYIVHLFFGLSVTGTTVLLWVLLGLLLAPDARHIEFKGLGAGTGKAAAVAAVALAGVLFVGNAVYIVADHYYLKARLGASDPVGRIENAKRAVSLNPFNDIYRAEVGLAYIDRGYALLSDASTNPDAEAAAYKTFQQAEQSLKETIAFVPPEYDNYVFLANLYNTMGQYFDSAYHDDAIEIALRGIEVEHYGPAIRVEYARALASKGNVDEARSQLEFAVALDPAYGQGALILADLYEASGDSEKALEVLRTAEAWKPGQNGVAEQIEALETSLTAP